VEEALAAARRSVGLWPLDAFLVADAARMRNRAKVRGAGTGGEALLSLHGWQSWLLFHTLYSDPRWHEGFLALVRLETGGKSGAPWLKEAFGLPRRGVAPPEEWVDAVERACLERIAGR